MTLPDTLPGLAYLATYDRGRGRTVGQWSGQLLGAAAVADLYLDGYVVDDDGRVRRVAGRATPTNPVLADVWQRIGSSRPRRWQHWASQRGLRSEVRDDLAFRWIRVDRPGGFLRRERTSLRDPLSATRVAELVRSTLRSGTPVARLPERDNMLVALLAVAEVGTVLPRRTRRDNARRLKEMIARGGPPVDGLRRAISQAKSAYASGG
ncbi:MAG TPA: GPP34 family phosphoprotein [Micromonosporaceae bacterium]|nr:GPP34 family phosphoprotein [Micromonosporaceae bacterium]